MDKLGPALSLTDTQKPSVLTEVTSFLTKKKDILPLQATDKPTYTSKLAGPNQWVNRKIKNHSYCRANDQVPGIKAENSQRHQCAF